MKKTLLFLCFLLVALYVATCPNVCYGKTFTVTYYPPSSETEQLQIAISPDSTDTEPGGNPTFNVNPNTTLTVNIPDGIRYYYYVSSSGWNAGEGRSSPNFDKDFYFNPRDHTGSDYQAWYSPRQNLSVWEWPAVTTDTTVDVPVIGTVTIPDWASNHAMQSFFMGFAATAGVILFRSALRWFKRADGAGHSSD